MTIYRLSSRASIEIVDIFEFGILQFGPKQAERYRDDLKRCLALLADNPRMGRPAERLGEGVRRHEHGSHVVLYRVTGEGILVLALVHGAQVQGLDM